MAWLLSLTKAEIHLHSKNNPKHIFLHLGCNSSGDFTGYYIKTTLKEENYRLKNHLNVMYPSGVITVSTAFPLLLYSLHINRRVVKVHLIGCRDTWEHQLRIGVQILYGKSKSTVIFQKQEWQASISFSVHRSLRDWDTRGLLLIFLL